MGIAEAVIIAVGLSMDAFAVSVCKGLSVQKIRPVHMLKTAIWFGGFQALMPVIGYFLGNQFMDKISSFDHWVAAGLLAIIGINMICESLSKNEEKVDNSLDVKVLLDIQTGGSKEESSVDDQPSGVIKIFVLKSYEPPLGA